VPCRLISHVWRRIGSGISSGRHPSARGDRRARRLCRSAPAACPETVDGRVLSTLVVIWDFGATLIWGSPAPSKVRLGFALTGTGGAALLACAVVGMLAAGGAVRTFAAGRDRAALALSLTFAVSFIFWSVTVRFSPLIAAFGVLAGSAALWWASREPDNAQPAPQVSGLRHSTTTVLRAAAGVALPLHVARSSTRACVGDLRAGPTLHAAPPSSFQRSPPRSESQHSPSGSFLARPDGGPRLRSPARSSLPS
jgi:hypothetical protein